MEKKPGLPPDASAETFIGFDEDRHPFVLKWAAGPGCWMGIGFAIPSEDEVPRDTPLPLAFLAREEMAGHIVAHMPLPT